jgi:hypothetical protein
VKSFRARSRSRTSYLLLCLLLQDAYLSHLIMNGITLVTAHGRWGSLDGITFARSPWNRFPRSSSPNSFVTSHIPVYTPIPSSEGTSGEGAKNTFLPPSCSRPNAIWFFGARTPHRIQVVSLPASASSNSNASALFTPSPVSRMRPLVELQLRAAESGVGTALVQCGLTYRRISSIVSEAGLEQLLTLSSDAIAESNLWVVWPLGVLGKRKRRRRVSLIDIFPDSNHFRQTNLLPPSISPRYLHLSPYTLTFFRMDLSLISHISCPPSTRFRR